MEVNDVGNICDFLRFGSLQALRPGRRLGVASSVGCFIPERNTPQPIVHPQVAPHTVTDWHSGTRRWDLLQPHCHSTSSPAVKVQWRTTDLCASRDFNLPSVPGNRRTCCSGRRIAIRCRPPSQEFGAIEVHRSIIGGAQPGHGMEQLGNAEDSNRRTRQRFLSVRILPSSRPLRRRQVLHRQHLTWPLTIGKSPEATERTLGACAAETSLFE